MRKAENSKYFNQSFVHYQNNLSIEQNLFNEDWVNSFSLCYLCKWI